ncbi:MAG TPA: hypothetical protein VG986_18965 [Pseudolabrys sp.]|nr:hypothetical protein [Pseudolabrys sp.]
MSFIYTTLAFAEILILLASFVAVVFLVLRTFVRSFQAPKDPPPKPEDLRHLKRAGQSGLY